MGAHLIDNEFQSDKYPSTPRGKVPLSVKDTTAQDLLWAYAQRRRAVDAEFADDLEAALLSAGYNGGVRPAAEPAAPDGQPALLYGAVRHALDRVQLDPEFSYHMLGTETFTRLVRAEATFTGRSEDEVRKAREVDKQPKHRRRKPDCARNRDRVHQLEELLEEHDIDLPSAEER